MKCASLVLCFLRLCSKIYGEYFKNTVWRLLTALVSKFFKNELPYFCCFNRWISIYHEFNFNFFEFCCIGQSVVGEEKCYLVSSYEDATILIGNYETNTVTKFWCSCYIFLYILHWTFRNFLSKGLFIIKLQKFVWEL